MPRSPFDLSHRLDPEKLTVRAVIETPAGSKAKLAFDPDSSLYAVKKLFPVGLALPLDFGFIPSTLGGDGDPLDIMVLTEAEIPVGSLVDVRLLGAIEAKQRDDGQTQSPERNDRILARLDGSRLWEHIDRLDQLGHRYIDELNSFFATYKRLRGQTYEILGVGGPDRAVEIIESASVAFENRP